MSGRYLGMPPRAEADDEENSEEEMQASHAELGVLNARTAELAETIPADFEGLVA